jgi:hypothetical protein
VRWRAAVLIVALGTAATAGADPAYSVGPLATPETKAAVAAGRPPIHGYPVIETVDWNSMHVRPGSTVEALVTTSPNVVYVEGRYKYWNFVFDKVGVGKYHVTYKVPFLPPFLIGTWTIDVIARSVDGVEVRRPYQFSYGYF